MKFIKRTVRFFFSIFGLNISRNTVEEGKIHLTLDEIYKKKIKTNPIIFDVGANQGQSIERFLKIFNKPTIHAFEPISFEYESLKIKYNIKKKIFLNNIALGEKKKLGVLHVSKLTGNSSLIKLVKNTQWLKLRSKQVNVSEDKYIIKKEDVKIDSIDNYCAKNKIQKIDLLKIDTQGYEDKVLKGCKKMLSKNCISAIEVEVVFSDVYDKTNNIGDLEKFLIPNNFRLGAIKLHNNSLFGGNIFFADLLYLNKSIVKI
ncbi:FkbM family methyltransferase [Candidatus Pelagibacter sp.]|nr:FkbM family methyltransferase [Candidatus Pelagibacter sp.]